MNTNVPYEAGNIHSLAQQVFHNADRAQAESKLDTPAKLDELAGLLALLAAKASGLAKVLSVERDIAASKRL